MRGSQRECRIQETSWFRPWPPLTAIAGGSDLQLQLHPVYALIDWFAYSIGKYLFAGVGGMGEGGTGLEVARASVKLMDVIGFLWECDPGHSEHLLHLHDFNCAH